MCDDPTRTAACSVAMSAREWLTDDDMAAYATMTMNDAVMLFDQQHDERRRDCF
jgi:hypothetical protein